MIDPFRLRILVLRESTTGITTIHGHHGRRGEKCEDDKFFCILKNKKIGCYFIVIKIYKKKKEGVSSRTISPPIADPPQVLVKIPIDWS